VEVGWYQVVGCEWVVGAFALSTYPTGYGGVSYLFGSFAVVAFVVWAFWFGMLPVPCCLAGVAA
jgi:hypothetical protein